MVVDIAPAGPRKVAPRGQVSIPRELRDAIGIDIGDDVWMSVNPDRPGTLVLIPRPLMMELFRKGWTAVG